MRKLTVSLLFLPLCGTLSAQLAVRGDRIHTMDGPAIENGVIVIEGGKVAAVGSADAVTVPEGYRVLRAPLVTPGLIDAHTVVGFSGYLNQEHDQDQVEPSAPIQPELRAIDAFNARDRLVSWIRSFGVTTIHTGHGPGKLISGQTLIIKTLGRTVDDDLLVPFAALAATLGEGARESEKAPGTRSKAVAMLRSQLLGAQEYLRKLDEAKDGVPPPRDLGKEALGTVLRRERPLLVTVNRANDILTALRVAKEFNIRLILDGAAEGYLVLDQIKESGVSVFVHPTMQRSFGELENLSMETAAHLQEAGIPFAFQSGFEDYVPKTRVVLFEAAAAVRYGLPFEDALAALTIRPAQILGIDDRVGSIAVGRDADLVLFDGDPFEYTSHVLGVLIDGEPVSTGDAEWR